MTYKDELKSLKLKLQEVDEKLKAEGNYSTKYQLLLYSKKGILEEIDNLIKDNMTQKEKEIAMLNFIQKVDAVSKIIDSSTNEIDIKIKEYEDMIKDPENDEVMRDEYNKLIFKLLEQKLNILAVGNMIINSKTKPDKK